MLKALVEKNFERILMGQSKGRSKATITHHSCATQHEAFGYASVRARAKGEPWVIRFAHGPSPTSLRSSMPSQSRCSFFPFFESLL